MHINSLNTLILAAAFAGSTMAASSQDDWNSVVELQPGVKIEVVHGTLHKTVGLLTAASEDGITMQTDTGLRSLDRSEVLRVSFKSGSRKRRAIFGALAGAGAGAAVAAIGGANDSFEVQTGIVMAATATGGAGIGAAIGGATGGSRTVYRRPPK